MPGRGRKPPDFAEARRPPRSGIPGVHNGSADRGMRGDLVVGVIVRAKVGQLDMARTR
jgi:hypothetical protein